MMTQLRFSPFGLAVLALSFSVTMAARTSPGAVRVKLHENNTNVRSPSAGPQGDNFPKLPTVSTIMGASFESLGGRLAQKVDELSAKIHSVQQDDIHSVAQKKSELEVKLKGQEEQSRKMVSANTKVSQDVASLKKENDALRAHAKELHDSNKKIEKELSAMQSSLGVAAKDFSEASGEGEEEGGDSSSHSEGGNSLAQAASELRKRQQHQQQLQQQSEREAEQQLQQQSQQSQQPQPQQVQEETPQQYQQQQEEQDPGDQSGEGVDQQQVDGGNQFDQFDTNTDGQDGDGQGGLSFVVTKTVRARNKPTKSKPNTENKNFFANGLAAELKDLSKQVAELNRLEKQNDAKLDTAFHSEFEAGKKRQEKLKKEANQLGETRKRLQAVHTKLSESVKRLEAIHAKLVKQLKGVSDSLHRIENLTRA